MFIQGSLQTVFDALYVLGKIDPALKADWKLTQNKVRKCPEKFQKIMEAVNASSGNMELMVENLKSFDDESLVYLAMEVAREYVDFECSPTRH